MANITLTRLTEDDQEQFIRDPHDPETGEENNYEGENLDGMFRFEKQMKAAAVITESRSL